jgi:hypothetical protein
MAVWTACCFRKTLGAILLSLPLFLSGCVVVSMHQYRPVEVSVRRKDTGKPLANASVRVTYDTPIGYGVYYVLRVPGPVSGTTDEHGAVILPMADYTHAIRLFVNGRYFGVDRDLVVRGGMALGDRKYFPSPPPPKPGETPPVYLNAELRSELERNLTSQNPRRRVIWQKPIIIPAPFEVRLKPVAR